MSDLGDAIEQAVAGLVFPSPGQSVPLSRRQAVVTAVGASPTSATINLGGTIIPGVRCLASYYPVVGDVVFVDVLGSDLLIVGSTATTGPPMRLLAAGGALVGSSPGALSGGLLLQAASSVVTPNGSGDATVTYPTAFPNGIITVVVSNGDGVPLPAWQTITSYSLSGFGINVRTSANAAWTSATRVNWIAVGF